jgi:elongation factor P--(R)-beta-lysine ligase
MPDWRPAAALGVLRERAALLAEIRDFFAQRGVLEVETPLLASAANPDAAIEPLCSRYTPHGGGRCQPLYLQTSPEFPMKRLLAAGSGSIYQLSRAFRNGEQGRLHNPEFTLLEWYRVDFDHHQLMNEVDALVMQLLPGIAPAQRRRYADLFAAHTGVDLFSASFAELKQCAVAAGLVASAPCSREWLVEMLFELRVTPWLQHQQGVMVYDYPAAQASLAQLSAEDERVAQRFEYFLDGIELANGFHELRDAGVQRRRFEEENRKRQQAGAEGLPLDEHFLEALQQGLPDCSGVAMGVDRLLMLRCGVHHIDEVLAFPFDRA